MKKETSQPLNPDKNQTTSHPFLNYLILVGILLLIAVIVAYTRFIIIPQANQDISQEKILNNN